MKRIVIFLFALVAATTCHGQYDTADYRLTSIGESTLFKVATFRGKRYFVFEFDADQYNLELYNVIDKKNSLHTLYEIDSAKRKDLVLVVNGGMFQENLRPLGLYISEGTTYRQVNRDTSGYGNFYMQPNGIFILDKDHRPQVVTTKAYIKEKYKVNLATQSGPMLVANGVFNSHFNNGSSNLNIRNGVGVNKMGNIVLVTSQDRVNFYEFAELYRDKLQCPNALYLDGAVSQYYAPSIHRKPTQTFPLGIFLTISKK